MSPREAKSPLFFLFCFVFNFRKPNANLTYLIFSIISVNSMTVFGSAQNLVK
jgi:hypothetical protein